MTRSHKCDIKFIQNLGSIHESYIQISKQNEKIMVRKKRLLFLSHCHICKPIFIFISYKNSFREFSYGKRAVQNRKTYQKHEGDEYASFHVLKKKVHRSDSKIFAKNIILLTIYCELQRGVSRKRI